MKTHRRGQGVLITGGSSGLGRGLAEQLAAEGARVALVARRAGPLAEVVEAIRARGGEAHAIVADVAAKEATYAIAGTAASLVGPIDLLIHAASTLGPVRRDGLPPMPLLLDLACEDLAQVLEVNVVGPFRLTKAIAGAMVLRGAGTIVGISSDAAQEAYPRWGAYGASKAGFDQLLRVLAAELHDTGVRVVTVDPGEMDTPMHADAFGGDHDPAKLAHPREVAAKLLRALDDASVASGARIAVSSIPSIPSISSNSRDEVSS